jgi:hypothetical protein
MVGLEPGDELSTPWRRRDRERPTSPRRRTRAAPEVGQGEVRPARRLDHLLAERVDDGDEVVARIGGVQLDVVADAVRRPEAERGLRGEQPFVDDPLEHRDRVVVQVAGGRAHRRVVEDRGIGAA